MKVDLRDVSRLRAHRHMTALGQLIGELEVPEDLKDALRMRLRDLWTECKASMATKELP